MKVDIFGRARFVTLLDCAVFACWYQTGSSVGVLDVWDPYLLARSFI